MYTVHVVRNSRRKVLLAIKTRVCMNLSVCIPDRVIKTSLYRVQTGSFMR